MNFFGLGPGEVILIALVAMIVLGPEKLPEVAASAGKWIREFRRATDELTRQFTDENPFTEIQRAFSLTDEPAAPAPIVSPPEDVVPAVAEAPAVPAAPVPAALPPPVAPTVAVPARVKSSYFTGSAFPAGVDAEWTYGVPWRATNAAGVTLHTVLDDEWQLGVPTVIAPTDGAAEAAASPSDLPRSVEEAIDEANKNLELAEAIESTNTNDVPVMSSNGSAEPTVETSEAETGEPVAEGEPDEPPRAEEADRLAEAEEQREGLSPDHPSEESEPAEPVAVGIGDAKGKNSEEHQR